MPGPQKSPFAVIFWCWFLAFASSGIASGSEWICTLSLPRGIHSVPGPCRPLSLSLAFVHLTSWDLGHIPAHQRGRQEPLWYSVNCHRALGQSKILAQLPLLPSGCPLFVSALAGGGRPKWASTPSVARFSVACIYFCSFFLCLMLVIKFF